MWNTVYDTVFMFQCKRDPTLQRAEHIIIFFSKVHLWETKQMLMRHVAVIKTLYKDYNKALDSSLSTYERPITISRSINNGDSGFAVRVNDCLERRGVTELSVTHVGFTQSVNWAYWSWRGGVECARCTFAGVITNISPCWWEQRRAILRGARTRFSVGLKRPDFLSWNRKKEQKINPPRAPNRTSKWTFQQDSIKRGVEHTRVFFSDLCFRRFDGKTKKKVSWHFRHSNTTAAVEITTKVITFLEVDLSQSSAFSHLKIDRCVTKSGKRLPHTVDFTCS